MSAAPAALLAVVLISGWVAIYRFPFRKKTTANRVGLFLAGRFSGSPEVCFAVFATIWYVVFGLLACLLFVRATGADIATMTGSLSLTEVTVATAMAIVGSVGLVSIGMSALYALKPDVDAPAAISSVTWVRRAQSLPQSVRFTLPMAGALVEEVAFRGVLLFGLIDLGMSTAPALAVSTALFILGQIVTADNRLAQVVFGWGAVAVSALGGLLVVGTGALLPAVVAHCVFAGFYTNLSWGATK